MRNGDSLEVFFDAANMNLTCSLGKLSVGRWTDALGRRGVIRKYGVAVTGCRGGVLHLRRRQRLDDAAEWSAGRGVRERHGGARLAHSPPAQGTWLFFVKAVGCSGGAPPFTVEFQLVCKP